LYDQKVCDLVVIQATSHPAAVLAFVKFLYVRPIFPRVWSKAATLLIAPGSNSWLRLRGVGVLIVPCWGVTSSRRNIRRDWSKP
jgi:hypothetical protein